ncbi:site-2 protease family protein [Rhodopseudomonas pseudopalustris]|uniref:Zn-dependent protease (Includes SpoIVFB) n=1 Tax=Rhodopseudomonas pseudopalustris TaxID=1513892 RepID=A0A1H8Q1N2_9BRAD|nr:site-2 protease family protein [Rhodopseudomonas pseudopalustris]SEO47986.1 Zn-dependent protease (includes SpoIVFB) [Rhodopseudomonas pseudopalustris]
MTDQFSNMMLVISVWALPLVIAITFHEAAHAYVARMCGDDTAWMLGRVTLNPIKHIDPFGTILLPLLLLALQSPFLFGYAKPVPVNFRGLRHPRRDMILVAAAGPAINLVLALIAAIAIRLIDLPGEAGEWLMRNFANALLINVVLAIFNLIPIPPLDGGRIAVGALPRVLARPLARLEPYGMLVLIGLVFLLPLAGFGGATQWIAQSSRFVVEAILRLTGNA